VISVMKFFGRFLAWFGMRFAKRTRRARFDDDIFF